MDWIAEFKRGDQLKQGRPSTATLHGPTGLLEARYLVRSDHLRWGTTWSVTGPKLPITLTPHLSSTRGHSQHFVAPFARIETFLHSFLPSTITLWNSLPNSLVKLDDILKFWWLTFLPFPCWLTVHMIICVLIILLCEFYTVKNKYYKAVAKPKKVVRPHVSMNLAMPPLEFFDNETEL